MRRIRSRGCAPAATGQTAIEPPRRLTNSRRLIIDTSLRLGVQLSQANLPCPVIYLLATGPGAVMRQRISRSVYPFSVTRSPSMSFSPTV